jgi:hypothetical protein
MLSSPGDQSVSSGFFFPPFNSGPSTDDPVVVTQPAANHLPPDRLTQAVLRSVQHDHQPGWPVGAAAPGQVIPTGPQHSFLTDVFFAIQQHLSPESDMEDRCRVDAISARRVFTGTRARRVLAADPNVAADRTSPADISHPYHPLAKKVLTYSPSSSFMTRFTSATGSWAPRT